MNTKRKNLLIRIELRARRGLADPVHDILISFDQVFHDPKRACSAYDALTHALARMGQGDGPIVRARVFRADWRRRRRRCAK